MHLFVRSLKFDRVFASRNSQSRHFDYYSTNNTATSGEQRLCSTYSNPPTALPKPRLNYRDIAENATYKSHNAFNRNAKLVFGTIQNIESLWREHKDVSSRLNAKRNLRSLIGETIRGIRSGGAIGEAQKLQAIEEAKVVKKEVLELEVRLGEVEEELLQLALAVPNDTHPDSPLGSESAAVTLSTHGPSPISASPERDHLNVGRTLQLLDFEAAALVTGTSWYYLKNEGALLEMALTNYALSNAIRHGFTPFMTPDVVRAEVAARCGFHPRDHPDSPVSQMYHIASNSLGSNAITHPELVLAGTAEIPLAALFAGQTLAGDSLPFRLVGVGRAFRPEAGARGAESRGLYRVHQFTKVELFAVTREEDSEEMMEEIRRVQVQLFEGLGLSLRVQDMPTEELGASAYRKYDIEAWMPGRGRWGEISSTSNCTDYQSRRLHLRYTLPSHSQTARTNRTKFTHTLNGTAAAIPRLIIALIENGARFNGEGKVIGLDLPSVLKPFWFGERDTIGWI